MRGSSIGIAVLAIALGIAACGGGDDTDAAGEAGAAPTRESAPGATEPTAAATAGCLKDDGLDATVNTVANAAVGSTSSVHIDVQPQNGVQVTFFEQPAKAKTFANDEQTFLSAGGGGGAEVVGDTVVVSHARPGAAEEVSAVKACLGA